MPKDDKDLVRGITRMLENSYRLQDGLVSFEFSENIPKGYFAVVTVSSVNREEPIRVNLTEDQCKALFTRLNGLTPNIEDKGTTVEEIKRCLGELGISFGEA